MFGVSALITEQRYRKDIDRFRSLHMYRGMPNADFRIITSLQRICKDKRFALEPSILENFTNTPLSKTRRSKPASGGR